MLPECPLPAPPVAVLEPGDFFGAMSLLTGEPPVATNVEAVGQTEILEIRASTIKELLSRNSNLAPAFSQNLAEHQEHSLRGTLQPQPRIEADAILERIDAFYNIGGSAG